MKLKLPPLNVILCLVAVALFFAGRFTAPRSHPNNQRVLDSLSKDIATRVKREALYKKIIKVKDSTAEYWKAEAQKPQKQKTVVITKYNADTTRNRSLSVLQRDSVIRTIFLQN